MSLLNIDTRVVEVRDGAEGSRHLLDNLPVCNYYMNFGSALASWYKILSAQCLPLS